MRARKIVTYVLMISKVFPATHPRSGQPTYFREKILCKSLTMEEIGRMAPCVQKITTIRENYDLWARRAEKINAGEAILSLRQWSGKPYRSKQVEFLKLEKIGVQRIKITNVVSDVFGDPIVRKHHSLQVIIDKVRLINSLFIVKNDGLNEQDFKWWFNKDIDGVIIHFTDFKY